MSNRRLLKFTVSIIGWFIGVGFLIVFWQQIVSSGTDWEQVVAGINWKLLALATCIVFLGMGIRSQLSYLSQREFNYPFSRTQAYRAWFLSQLGKYIPGGIWMFAARAVFYRRSGMSALLATAVMVWEMLSIIGTGLLLGLTSIFVIRDSDWLTFIEGGSLLLIIGLLCSLMVWPWQLLARTRIAATERMLQIMTNLGKRRFRLLWRLSWLSLLSWLIIGVGFYVLTASVVDISKLPLWYAIVTYGIAWTVGFLVVFAPAGLGPREAVITLLFTPYYGVSLAFSIAMLARIWWTLAEGLHILLATGIQLRPKFEQRLTIR